MTFDTLAAEAGVIRAAFDAALRTIDLIHMGNMHILAAASCLRARARRLARKGPPHMQRRRRGEAHALACRAVRHLRAADSMSVRASASMWVPT